MNARWHVPSASATPWDGMGESSLTPAQRLVLAEHRDAYDRLHPGLLGEADFFNGYERDSCPSCRGGDLIGWGRDGNGVRRWRCEVDE